MKRWFWSIGLSLATAAGVHAQTSSGPAAALGLPRASLGLPVPVRDVPGAILPAVAELAQPLLPPAVPGNARPQPLSPYNLISDPKPMPSAPLIDEGKKEALPTPTISGPAITSAPIVSSVNTEDPLVQSVISTPPFLSGNRVKLSAEYLMWWTSGMSAPPLLTTGPAASNGALGSPGVSVLFGNQELGPTFHPGVRTGFEWFRNPCCRWGLDSHLFWLAQRGQSVGFASAGDPLLARPFYSVNTGNTATSELIASPGLYTGGIRIGNSTSLWGTDFNFRRKYHQGARSYVDGLLGFRYLDMNESLTIMERSAQIAPVNPAVPVISGMVYDRFATSNQFYGAQIGAAAGIEHGRWSFDLRTLVAFGVTQSILQIDGAQNVILADGTNSIVPSGLYALSSNSGRHYNDNFAIVPEVTFNIGYNVTQKCRVFVGYNLLYWSSVLRPGNQIDQGLDVNRIPNFTPDPNTAVAPRPTVPYTGRDFIAQGLNFGLMLKW